MKFLKHGRVNPLRLSVPQTYVLTGVVFAGNVAVLVALIAGAARHPEALEAVAAAARLAALESKPEKPVAPPPLSRAEEPWRERRSYEGPTTAGTLQISGPAGWQWQGCRADSDRVEVFFASPDSEKIAGPKF